MFKSLSYVLCAVAAAGAAAYAAVQPPPDTLVLQHATIIDGLTADVGRDMTVVIRGGRIESVSRAAAVVARDDTVIDLQNRFLGITAMFVDAGRRKLNVGCVKTVSDAPETQSNANYGNTPMHIVVAGGR